MGLRRFTFGFIALYNLISCVISVDNQMSDNFDDGNLYGYQDGDVTQGVGYGHYLHPFYYQGTSKKYYNCAVADDWKPLSGDQAPAPVDSNHHLQKPHKSLSPVKKYQYLDEKVKKKVFVPAKTNHVTPARSPREKSHDPLVTRRNYRIQNRNDYTVFGDNRLQQDHAKLVNDINGLSEYQPFLKKFREDDQILASESDNDQNINIAENPMEEYFLHQGIPTSTRQVSDYKVHENPIEVLPKFQNVPTPHKFKTTTSKMPFQKYKKFRIVTVKPSSIIHLKYLGSRNKKAVAKEELVRPQYMVQELNQDGHPYQFVTPVNEADMTGANRYQQRPQYEVPSNVMKYRQGRNNHSPVNIPRHPRLTMLEQFLLLFPRIIR